VKNLQNHCRDFHDGIFSKPTASKLTERFKPAGKLSLEEAFSVYRHGYSARALEALGEIFEKLWRYLGDEDFLALVEAYILENPSTHRNLADWGRGFTAYLQNQNLDLLVTELARFCWIHHRIFHCREELVPIHEMPGYWFQRQYEVMESPVHIPRLWQAIEVGSGLTTDLHEPCRTVFFLKDLQVSFSVVECSALFMEALERASRTGRLSLEILVDILPQEADEMSSETALQKALTELSGIGLFFPAVAK
jgi:hypothetical protein